MKKIITLACILFIAANNLHAQCAANFQYHVTTFNPPTVQFMDSSFSPSFPLTYMWDFGDGSPASTSPSPLHTYPANGSYFVCLTIQDTAGCINQYCDSILVNPPAPQIYASLFVDSMAFFACTAPASIQFYFYAQTSGYLPTDIITFNMEFGDGIDSTFQIDVQNLQSGNNTFYHMYQNAGNYTPQLTATAPDNNSSTQTTQTINVTSSCGNISGYVYDDANNNCTLDAGEELAGIALEIYNGNQFVGWATTDATGLYSFNLPTGNTYDIHVNANNGILGHYSPTCPATGVLSVSTIPSSSNNFGISCPAGFDLQGSMTPWRLRPGFEGSVCVFFFNELCDSPSGQVEVTFPSQLTPLPDSSGNYVVNGQTVTYSFTGPDYYWSFCVAVDVSLSAVIGDSVCMLMNITPTIGDADPSNNLVASCFPIVGSFDPNDKYGSPAGEGVDGFILPNTDLTYTIRFQNTGNAEAYNIYILDSLSPNLEATSVEIIATSHQPMIYSLLTGNVLRFSYDNINLPDSNTNEPASHGYVTYRVKQVGNIAHMAQITNTAGIYFDFNAPVITNTTLHTVDHFLSVTDVDKSVIANLYPNPANQKCQITFRDGNRRTITVSDVLGKEVFRVSIQSDNYSLNTEKFAEGLYTINIIEEGKNSVAGKLIVKH